MDEKVFVIDKFDEPTGRRLDKTSLLFTALALVIARAKQLARDRWRRHWVVLGAGLLFLSVDEIAGFHESVNTVTTYSWAIPAFAGAVAVGLIEEEGGVRVGDAQSRIRTVTIRAAARLPSLE